MPGCFSSLNININYYYRYKFVCLCVMCTCVYSCMYFLRNSLVLNLFGETGWPPITGILQSPFPGSGITGPRYGASFLRECSHPNAHSPACKP